MLSPIQQFVKRVFDVFFSIIGLIIVFIPILIFIIIASIQTTSFGVFKQKRVGKHGKLFTMYKIKSMDVDNNHSMQTNDERITRFGKFLRRTKLDELPQLFNVLLGDMSIVGPRPDIEGYADELLGEDRIILSVRPGITGPATLKFSNEERILAKEKDPVKYNDEIIWPQKVKLNKEYIEQWSLKKDVSCLMETAKEVFRL